MIIHDGNGTSHSATNPIHTQPGRDSSDSFGVTIASSNATTATQVQAATVGKSIYLTDLVISAESAMTVNLQDSDGTPVIRNLYFPATSIFAKAFQTPIKVTSAKALNVKSSVAAGISVTATGFIV
jgi:hypothetical protein